MTVLWKTEKIVNVSKFTSGAGVHTIFCTEHVDGSLFTNRYFHVQALLAVFTAKISNFDSLYLSPISGRRYFSIQRYNKTAMRALR